MPHTPGPWSNQEFIGCTFGPDGSPIMTAGGGCPGPEGEEGRANARLIAVSPELLSACQALPLDLLDKEDYGAIDAADFVDNAEAFLRAMRLAKAAIAKT